MSLNKRMFWKVRAIPKRVIAYGFIPLIFLPSNFTVPSVGVYTPVNILNTVVLPAPFGPIKP